MLPRTLPAKTLRHRQYPPNGVYTRAYSQRCLDDSIEGSIWEPIRARGRYERDRCHARRAAKKPAMKRVNIPQAAGTGILLLAAASGGLSPARIIPAVPSQVVLSPFAHAPRRSLGPAPTQWGRSDLGIFESDNWSGYAVVGTAFTEARGSWRIPRVNCAVNPNGAVSFWVGIDGWNNDTVEQTGTESQCNGYEPVTYAWYEFVPKAGVTIRSVKVSPGEDMEADVRYNGLEFVVTIWDLTTGRYFRTSAAVPRAKRASAEWIAESNGYTGLPDFDAVRFGNDFTKADDTNFASDATASGPIGAFGKRVQVSILGRKNVDEAVPSLLSFDGTSFTVTYWSP
jgi:Peptidase A4 family